MAPTLALECPDTATATRPCHHRRRPGTFNQAQIHERIRLGHYDRPEFLDAIIDAVITQALGED